MKREATKPYDVKSATFGAMGPKGLYTHFSCAILHWTFLTFAYVVIVFGIPLYELAIYPLARNWIPSTLKRVGIGAFGTIIVAFIALSVDMVVHARTNATVECMFVENSTSGSVQSIS